MKIFVICLIIFFDFALLFDLRQHLGTKTVYYSQSTNYINPPENCELVHVQYVN